MNKNLFDHIAYATRNTDKSLELFSILGFQNILFYKQKIEKFQSYITKLQSHDGQVIELVEPIMQQSVVNNLLVKNEAALYHAAFLTADLLNTVKQLTAIGAVTVTEPMAIPYPATSDHKNYKTSHMYHPNVGLFEVTGPIIENK